MSDVQSHTAPVCWGGDKRGQANEFAANTEGTLIDEKTLQPKGKQFKLQKDLNHTTELQTENTYFCISGFWFHLFQDINLHLLHWMEKGDSHR